MSKIWVISPFNSEFIEEFEKIWAYDRKNGIISIGWAELGNISLYTLNQLKEIAKPYEAGILYKFYHAIDKGHTIVARYGLNCIAGIGTVVKTAHYDPNMLREMFREFGSEEYAFPHHLEVEWDPEWSAEGEQGYWDYGKRAFGLQALQSISAEKLERLIAAFEEDDIDED